MHFVYGFCDGNARAAVQEYQRHFPDRRISSRSVFTRIPLLWLHLKHQSVLEEGQTMPVTTADSNRCHSDVTACGNKGMSSQTAYEDFLLFPSPI